MRRKSNRSQKAHREAMEGLASLARSLSHALNNILAGSQGNLALLQYAAQPEAGEREAIMADIAAALGDAQRLAWQLSAISYWQPFKASRLAPADFLREHEARMQELLGAHRAIMLDIQNDLPAVEVDPHYLELALNALVIHASSDRGNEEPLRMSCRMVDAGWSSEEPGARMVMIGIGLSEAAIPRSETEQALLAGMSLTKSPSSALGLKLVRQFAMACNGDVRVKAGGRTGYQVDLILPAAS